MNAQTILAGATLVAFVGCTTEKPIAEKGFENTIPYTVQIDASEPGKVEINNNVIGTTPVSIKIFGDRDGTFHNFGNDEFVVRALPVRTNEFSQTRIYKTGTLGIKDDKIPQRIYFDFSAAYPAAK